MPILRTPIGFDGPAGIERGMLFAQSLPGLIHGAFASLRTTLKSPIGVG